MRSFREFFWKSFNEAGVAPPTQRGSNPNGMPDLYRLHTPGAIPPGGYTGVQNFFQSQQQKDINYLIPMYQTMGSIYNTVSEVIRGGGTPVGSLFQKVSQNQQNPNIFDGIARSDIEGTRGSHGKLSRPEIERLVSEKVLIPDNNYPDVFSLDKSVLWQKMEEVRQKMIGHEKTNYWTGKVDQFAKNTMGQMTQGTIGLSPSANGGIG